MQATSLTQQLLTFSRGGAPIKKKTSVTDLIKDSATFALRGSNVSCNYSFPDDLWLTEADEAQLNQVVNNLVINAQQAMPKGGIIQVSAENMTIHAENTLSLKAGKYVKISIKDQGIGISAECLLKIFDPYFTTKQKGSGLGLATAYSIIKKHGGVISVESELNAGTIFQLYLPALEKEILIKKKAEEKPLIGKGKILLMDDEAVIRTLALRLLKRIGYEVHVANDGAEAIKLYREANEPFDAVIMDLTIPGGMGGKEAIKKLLEIDPDVKAVVSSGYSNDPIMANFSRYGFKSVIAKPYNIRRLSEVLQKVINS